MREGSESNKMAEKPLLPTGITRGPTRSLKGFRRETVKVGVNETVKSIAEVKEV
jgi:hypothetical protein